LDLDETIGSRTYRFFALKKLKKMLCSVRSCAYARLDWYTARFANERLQPEKNFWMLFDLGSNRKINTYALCVLAAAFALMSEPYEARNRLPLKSGRQPDS
jgi:hypothetical protein